MANKNGFFKLEILILAILSQQDCYGYQLTSLIKKRTNNHLQIKDGTLYPILFKLAEEGYISSYDMTVGKKIRVYYHLEESGKEKFKDMVVEFNETVDYIKSIINEANEN